MVFTVKKPLLAGTLGLCASMLLTGCGYNQSYIRQADDGDSYLKASGLEALHSPSGMILPIQNDKYAPPFAGSNGPVGKQLDIRPPAQPLALIDGTRSQFSGNSAALLFDDNDSAGRLWSQVVSVINARHFPIASQQNASQSLTTDWIVWDRADEDDKYSGRYQIDVQQQGYHPQLTVRLLALQQKGKDITSALEIQRYTMQMFNELSTALAQGESSNNAVTSPTTMQLNVQSGADETGLPALIVRGSFDTVWQRLPQALKRIGLTPGDNNRSQGSLSISYKSPGTHTWDKLGVKDPALPQGNYKIQVGDLNNRSTLQFLNSKGQTLSQSQNDALVAVFQAALNE